MCKHFGQQKALFINLIPLSRYIMISTPKLLLLATLVLLSVAYTEQEHVLVLGESDFPSVVEEFPLILIEFYAPWCGHCKHLAPVYIEVAAELHAAGSPVRLAKIDADEHSSVKGQFGVQGFPTLIFFSNGQQVKYNGQRSKDAMVNWLLKKTRDPVVAIEASQVEGLSSNNKVNIVFYGDIASAEGKIISNIASLDDFNTYYAVQGSEQPEGTVQIIRPFGESVSTPVTEEVKKWIGTYERPTVYTFDDRTIGEIFSEGSSGIILFQSADNADAVNQAFKDAAHELRVVSGKDIIFTDIPTTAEHYNGLAQYIKIDVAKSPIVLLDGAKRTKFVLLEDASSISSEKIVAFAESVSAGEAKEYKMDEAVSYVESAETEAEEIAPEEEL